MDTFWIILLFLVVLGGGIATIAIVRRQRYIKALEAQGWTFENSPTLDATFGLNCPPFGVGYNRSIDDLIAGTTAQGIPFRVFQYGSQGHVAVLTLPRPLPELYIAAQPRADAVGQQKTFGVWTVTATDPAWAEAAVGAIGASVDAMAGGQPVDLSVDGNHLVAVGAPREAVELRAFLEALAPVAQALAGPALAQFTGPNPPAELSLYGYPQWIYRPRDDRFLDQVVSTGGGQNHAAEDVVLGEYYGIRMIALTHTWQTTRTETSTDANGNTTTRTVTDNHSEALLEFHLPWPFGDMSVNWSGWGDRVRFESADFNSAFTVRSPTPKFAYDVFHPRQMEFLLRAQPTPFAIESSRVRFAVQDVNPEVLTWRAQFLVAFLAGVPSFVWEDLGHPEPPISRDLDGF